jgi:hypothetical protein
MAIPRGYRFDIPFDTAFPQGLVLIGDVTPDNEYQTRENKAAGRPVRQKVDDITGKRQWKATVTDPDEPTAKRASFEITFIADVQPVPPTAEVLPGMRPIKLEGLTAEPGWPAMASSTISPTFTGQPASQLRHRMLEVLGRRSQLDRPAGRAASKSRVRLREPRDGRRLTATRSGY